jgi:hypothetical protein
LACYGQRMPRAHPGIPTLHQHAEENLRFIRDTMARAADFTAVPGIGGTLMGVSALATAAASGPPAGGWRWLSLWIADAAVAAVIGATAARRKARRSGASLFGAAGRRFALAFAPPIGAAVLLTALFAYDGLVGRLPGCWLLLYGAAVTSGGAFSVRVVPIMGGVLMCLGGIALVAPQQWGHLFMAAGFGVVQIVFGTLIARRYGG